MLSLSELQRAASAVERVFAGHRVEKVLQTDETAVALVLYGRTQEGSEGVAPGGGASAGKAAKRVLVLSCHPQLGRMGVAPAAPRAPDALPPFAKLARPHLTGTRLRSVRADERDRLVRLLFAAPRATEEGDADARAEGAPEDHYEIVLALTGGRANLFLLGSDRRVLGALRPFARTRPDLRPGATWGDPPTPPPRGDASEGEERFPASGDDTSPGTSLALLRAIEAHYSGAQIDRASSELAKRLATALRKERKHAEKRLDRVRAELEEADQASVLQRHGDLLKSVLSTLEPGQREVVVEDWESGEPVTIPLDPTKTPKQNLDATFKRYQKLIRRLTKAGAQLDEAQRRVDELAALADEVDAAKEAEPLRALAERSEVASLLARHAPPPAEAQRAAPKPKGPFADLPGRLRPRRYLSSDGLEIWVGRSDAGNDHLSTRLARGKDLFFHVEASPGSHVVLRTEGRDDPPSESVLEAAELAVRFSKQKNAGRCDVHVVPIKNVKKPRGAKPGLVMVTGGRSLHLRRDEERLARILSAQIGDDEPARGQRG